jgi:hypothetical protein
MKLRERLPSLLGDEEDEDRLEVARAIEAAGESREPQPLKWYLNVAILVAAALPRVYYIYFVTGTQNGGEGAYGDVWHHWQIAYLTKEIGLTAPDGPRLWDLKGLEYFWGALHPYLMDALFFVTGSTDIVLERWLSLLAGSVVALLTFHICRRFWGTHVALAALAFAIVLPTSVMNDASGMLEPLGVVLVLTGIWAWNRRHGFWSGLAFGLATMARAEAWIFSLGMVVAALMKKSARNQTLPLLGGFVLVMVLYMKTLLDHTGNPIYPVYWNFVANAAGEWEASPISAGQASVRPYLGAIVVLAAIGLAVTLWKRPPGYMYLTFGFGNWVFVAGMLGFTSYLASWVWWMPITRVFAYAYEFTAVVVVLFLFTMLPRWLGRHGITVAWGVTAAALIVVQLAWNPINAVFGQTESAWQAAATSGRQLGGFYNTTPGVAGGSLLVPPDRPDLTYMLAQYGNVSGRHLVSELYDPFYYLPAGYTYTEHPDVAGPLLQCWLDKTGAKMWAVNDANTNYRSFIADNAQWFTLVGDVPEAGWQVWTVQTPKPAAGFCEEATRAAPH